MLDHRRAAEIVDRIDLAALPICYACHLDLAFALVEEKPARTIAAITTRTTSWVWLEISVELLAILRRAQMKKEPWADEALADLERHASRSRIVREIVRRVATEMADDMRGRGLGPPPQPLVLTFLRR